MPITATVSIGLATCKVEDLGEYAAANAHLTSRSVAAPWLLMRCVSCRAPTLRACRRSVDHTSHQGAKHRFQRDLNSKDTPGLPRVKGALCSAVGSSWQARPLEPWPLAKVTLVSLRATEQSAAASGLPPGLVTTSRSPGGFGPGRDGSPH